MAPRIKSCGGREGSQNYLGVGSVMMVTGDGETPPCLGKNRKEKNFTYLIKGNERVDKESGVSGVL